jgi:hypothetical protein
MNKYLILSIVMLMIPTTMPVAYSSRTMPVAGRLDLLSIIDCKSPRTIMKSKKEKILIL